MKKKIAVAELRVGMYVTELDRPWRETPFLFQGFEIRDQEEIEQLRRLCQYVYIEVPEGSHNTSGQTAAAAALAVAPQAITEAELMRRFADHAPLPTVYADRTELEEEIEAVREAYTQARALVDQIMRDVRLGKSIDAVATKGIVKELLESVIRNPDALSCFIQLKKKDEYTAQHSMRVCILALAFGRHLGLNRAELEILGIGALLHDIGKMKVPDEILNKPGRLSDYEFAVMKSHVPRGVEILERTSGIPAAAVQVARCHHERYDGGGYVMGIKGDRIGLFGMIGGIVDCYDAITSDRAYHDGMSAHAALRQMYEWRGKDFHPGLIEQFIQCMGIYPIGSVVRLNTGDIGVVITINRVRRLKPRVRLVLQPDQKPYPAACVVDLMTCATPDGRPCEIVQVLEPGDLGVDPARYLPVAASA